MKTFLKIFLYSLILHTCLSMIGTYSLWWKAVIESVVYVTFTLWMLKKYSQSNRRLIYAAIFIGLIFFELPIRIIHFKSTAFNLVHSLCVIWAFITIFLYCEYKKRIILVLGCLTWLFGMTEGITKWQEYCNYGKYTSNQTVNIANCSVIRTNGILPIKDLKADYIILEFWASYCSVCIESFPEIQELSEKYKQDTNVLVASIFIANEKRNETIETGEKIVKEKKCDFPVFSIFSNNPLVTIAQVEYTPTTLILDKYHNVIFKGSLKLAKQKLNELCHTD